MLTPEATYPYPGSYALLVDSDLPPEQQCEELVRIHWRRVDSEGRGFIALSFPLRDGASGNKIAPADQLIDATPLTPEEEREFHDLDRALKGRSLRTPKQKRQLALRDTYLSRVMWAPHMVRLLREMRSREAMRRAA
jgi:hypothetical protein